MLQQRQGPRLGTYPSVRLVFSVLVALAFALLASCGGGGGGGSSPPPSNPVPTITSLSPSWVTAGAAAQTLAINGTNFLSSSTVTYSGVGPSVTFLSSAQLSSLLGARDEATPGSRAGAVTVRSRAGGASDSVNLISMKPPRPVITSVTSILA
jgi:hypothetical protein